MDYEERFRAAYINSRSFMVVHDEGKRPEKSLLVSTLENITRSPTINHQSKTCYFDA
jgi:hypothetical protein